MKSKSSQVMTCSDHAFIFVNLLVCFFCSVLFSLAAILGNWFIIVWPIIYCDVDIYA